MRFLHSVMPMAGEGSRFLRIGITTPKPLISVGGMYLFQRAIKGLADIPCPRKYTFIVRAEHVRNFAIDKRLYEAYPDANVVSVEKTTRGATETCLLAKEYISPDDAVVVQDCDLEFYSADFNAGIASDLKGNTDISGRLISFRANHPRYSYAETDSNGFVKRTAEKVVISNNALAGAYYFSRGDCFVALAQESVKRYETAINPSKELYLSLLYNILLEHGDKVQLHYLSHYRSFGTPEELQGIDWTSELR